MKPSNPIPSPCNSICVLDVDTCTGCGRTLEEIVSWPLLNENEKRKIVERVCPSLLSQ